MTASSAITAARDFIAAGGRLLISPAGEFMPAIDHGLLLDGGPGSSVWTAAKAIVRMSHVGGSVAALRRLVRNEGSPFNGWLVLGSC